MNKISEHAQELRKAVENPVRGVVGLVEDLLQVCREHGLQLDWQADHCRLRGAGGDWENVLDFPLRKSVFRAILARVAALCNERIPNSVSPYGGRGKLAAGANLPAVFRVAFVNTPAEQSLELMAEPAAAAETSLNRGPSD
jgi:hypothetical protein